MELKLAVGFNTTKAICIIFLFKIALNSCASLKFNPSTLKRLFLTILPYIINDHQLFPPYSIVHWYVCVCVCGEEGRERGVPEHSTKQNINKF